MPSVEKLAIAFLLVILTSSPPVQHAVAETDVISTDETIVVTKEVAEKLKAKPPSKRCHESGGVWVCDAWGGPLEEPAEFPILTVNVNPPKPEDFFVTINGTSYAAGKRLFRVLVGEINIAIRRIGKKGCQLKFAVTMAGPNSVSWSTKGSKSRTDEVVLPCQQP